MKKYVFGVDIGGTSVKIGFFETTGNLVDSWEITTRTLESGKYILSDIAEAVENKLKEKNVSYQDIQGIGLGVPGPVSQDGTVLKCVNLGWGVLNVESELEKLTGLKVKVGNDANVAALGEMWQGGGEGYKNIVMVTLGTGVGGGVIINEHILPGTNGAAGEIGHLPMKDDEIEVCGCGNKGCLEQYASATGVVRMTKKYLAEHDEVQSTLKTIANFTAKDIFDAAKNGDQLALTMVDRTGALLGKGLATVASIINPEVFVIGGGMSMAGELLLQSIRNHYMEYAFHATCDTEFKAAKLGNNAGIYGGVRLMLG